MEIIIHQACGFCFYSYAIPTFFREILMTILKDPDLLLLTPDKQQIISIVVNLLKSGVLAWACQFQQTKHKISVLLNNPQNIE